MKLNGANILIETLIEEGVKSVFGYPGGTVLDIYDSLYKYSDKIKHYIAAHEQGAAHAADGFARATGEVGVCIATSGPGATNLVTGIATAYLDSIPVVFITGNVALNALGKDSFQEVDIRGITIPITKHNYIVKDIKDLKATVKEAFKIAKSGRPGPVLVDIPKNIQQTMYEFKKDDTTKKDSWPTYSQDTINNIVDLIKESKKPFIYSGGGIIAGDASDELLQLANNIDAYIGTTLMGESAIDNTNPRFLGMCGMHGSYAASVAKQECDLCLAIGVRFSDRAVGDKNKYLKNAKIVHIDIDIAEINKNVNVDEYIIGNVKEILLDINKQLQAEKKEEWSSRIAQLVAKGKEFMQDPAGITPKKVIEAVRANANIDTPIVTDVGQHQMWTSLFYNFSKPRTFITSGGLGTMGFGLGASIGTCIGNHKIKTVLFTGDGSFGMNLNEMATAVTYNLPIIVIVMNNGVLGMVRQWQKFFYEERYSTTTLGRKTDFVALANAFGAQGLLLDKEEHINSIMKKAFEIDGPVVIDCIIDMDENVFPMIPPGGSIDNMMLKVGE